ncbi:hypothetical protein F5X68DRAFT_188520 [Plectosphaerella plurivora]|uniref:Uncharacterized protein n=1 Tax=Plectosphaerella plurivora TaxID=936078 RepID=A0A9P8VHU2_9PEZI|nr:hypothetical protein F5X68DRAFT_188520 [Plectosphaerella plurivora]
MPVEIDRNKQTKYGAHQWTAPEIGGTAIGGVFGAVIFGAICYLVIWPAIKKCLKKRRKDPHLRDLELQAQPQRKWIQLNAPAQRQMDGLNEQFEATKPPRYAPPCHQHPPQPEQQQSYRPWGQHHKDKLHADTSSPRTQRQQAWPGSRQQEPLPVPSAGPSRTAAPQAALQPAPQAAPSQHGLSRNVSVLNSSDITSAEARESMVSPVSSVHEQPFANMPTAPEPSVNPYAQTSTPRSMGPQTSSHRYAPSRQGPPRHAPPRREVPSRQASSHGHAPTPPPDAPIDFTKVFRQNNC